MFNNTTSRLATVKQCNYTGGLYSSLDTMGKSNKWVNKIQFVQ